RENLIHDAAAKTVQVERGGLKVKLAGVQAAEDEDLFHHAGHAAGISDDGLQLVVAFVRLHSPMEIAEQFRRRSDDAERSAKLMRDHRNEITLELAEFLFPFESDAQLFLGSFSLRDVLGERENVRRVVELDGFGREQNGEALAVTISPADLSLANRTDVAHVIKRRIAFIRVLPHPELGGRAPD